MIANLVYADENRNEKSKLVNTGGIMEYIKENIPSTKDFNGLLKCYE